MANAFDMFRRVVAPDYSDYSALKKGVQFTCPCDGFAYCKTQTNPTVPGGYMDVSINGVSNIKIYNSNIILLPVKFGDNILYSLNIFEDSASFIRFFSVREN